MTTRTFHRYHSLDALRASMMLLGLVLHSGVSYVVAPLAEAWPYKDPNTSTLFDLAVFFIHLFRMPVFFVAAGFFAAMLMQRDGAAGFMSNRAKRVLLPLAIFWPLVYPAIAAGFAYARTNAAGRVDMTSITSGAFLSNANLAHLWFLWDLMIFYAIAAALAPLAARMPGAWLRRLDDSFARIATSVTGALVMSAITALTLLPMSVPGLDTSVALLPPLRVLGAYSVFFVFGWLLYRRRDLIEPFGARWKPPMIAGAFATAAYLVLTVARPLEGSALEHPAACAAAGVAIWMLIFGIIGMFVHKLAHPRPVLRYLSDAAYWMYIVHLPFAIGVPGLLAGWHAPAVVKFAITLSSVSLVTIATYHYFVRSTAIGALLNGRRYPRGLAASEPVREAVIT